jgi:hypothetical protein
MWSCRNTFARCSANRNSRLIRTQCSADWSRVPKIGSGAVPDTMPTGEEAVVEIESRWTTRRREHLGVYPVARRRDVS